MDIATTADLYEGAPVMAWRWDIPRLPGTMDREGHRAEKGNVALLGIVTQARIQRLPLMAGGKLVDQLVQGNQASEPLLTPNFFGLGLVEPAYRITQLLVSAANRYHRRTSSTWPPS